MVRHLVERPHLREVDLLRITHGPFTLPSTRAGMRGHPPTIMTKKLLPLLTLILGIAIGISLPSQLSDDAPSVGGYLSSRATNTSAAVTNTSSQILAASSSRTYAAITNDGANVVYLSFGSTAVAGSGIRLSTSSAPYEINSENLYPGAIYAITPTGTSTVSIVQK